MARNIFRTSLSLAAFIPLLSACASTPGYSGPQSNAGGENYGASFKRSSPQIITAPPIARWWEQLDDPVLTKLIDAGLANSPSLKIAISRVKSASAVAAEQTANRRPSIAGSVIAIEAPFSGSNPLLSGGGGNGAQTSSNDFYNVGLNASWELDLFARRANSAKAAIAETQAAQAELSDAHVSLSSQIAATYIELRNWQHQHALLKNAVALQQEKLSLEKARVQYGTASAIVLDGVIGQIAGTKANLAALTAERSATIDRLAFLTGEVPGSLDPALSVIQPVPLPPREVSVGDPASLLQRRPDIRAAERRLASAYARIGVAHAQRFPTVSFLGLLGLGGSNPKDVFDTGNLSGLLLPRINWSFLDFGRVSARIDQAQAAADEAAANYDHKVLIALTEVEQALARFGGGRNRVLELSKAQEAAKNTERLTKARYDRGTASRIAHIDATLQRLQSDRSQATATADMTAAFITVQKSLGMGWADPLESK